MVLNKSIGIIGGADGPTTIFVATSVDWLQIGITIGVLVLAVVGIVVYKKKKKS